MPKKEKPDEYETCCQILAKTLKDFPYVRFYADLSIERNEAIVGFMNSWWTDSACLVEMDVDRDVRNSKEETRFTSS